MAKPGPKPGFKHKESTKQRMRESMAERQELLRLGRKVRDAGLYVADDRPQAKGGGK